MLSSVEWGEYRIGDLFEVLSYKKRFDANKVTLHSSGHPYIVRTSTNNGCKGYLQEDEAYLNEGNTLSFGQDTATVFYQEIPYFTGDKIKILKSKDGRFKKEIAPFFISTIDRAFSSFSWGSSSFSEKAIKAQLISLPTRDGKIDFMFMERFVAELKAQRVAELKAQRVAELKAYLAVTGLSDYTLTPEEQQAIQHFQEGNLQWGDYRLGDLFEVKRTLSFNKEALVSGDEYDYVTRTSQNQGILQTTAFVNKENLNEAGTWSLGLLQMDFFYRQRQWYAGQFVRKVVFKEQLPSGSIHFFTTVLNALKPKLLSVLVRDVNKTFLDSYVQLPTSSNKPDYTQMETFIRAIEKLVIRDVVLYADRELAATQQVINQ